MRRVDPAGRASDDGARRHGRHRARQDDAAPEPYPDDDGGWWQQAEPHSRAWPGAPTPDPRQDAPTAQARQVEPTQQIRQAEPAPRARQDAPAPRARQEPSRRAGRNLPAAIGVGLTLGAVALATLFLYRQAFLGVIIVAVCVACWEMVRAIRNTGAQPPLTPLLAGGVVMAILGWLRGPDALALGLLLTILALMVWRLADGPAGYHRDVMAGTLVAVYVPFLAGFAAMLAAPGDGAIRMVAMLAAVALSDTGGYVAGVLFGRHPMAPGVSPKKTWEGLAGSLVVTAVGSAVLLALLLRVDWWWGLVFGLTLSAASVLGDLAESLLKRDLGVKDMSSLLPGHGGLMDRLDSILFAAPAGYLLLSVLAPVSR